MAADRHASPMRELGALAPAAGLADAYDCRHRLWRLVCVLSYIQPTLIQVGALCVFQAPLALSLFGAGSVAGKRIDAHLADRAQMPTIGGTLAYSAAVLAGFSVLAQYLPTAPIGVLLLGSLVAPWPSLQIRLMRR
jgi:MFS transporter, DHA1 family, inner membrane transport protein